MPPPLGQRNFTLLWLGGLVSLTGDWMLRVGLPFFAYQTTGSTLATSGVLISGLIPRLLLGSVAGVFVDRWDRRVTMIVADLVMAAGLLPLLLVNSAGRLWIIFVVAAFMACVAQFFIPAESALLPNLVATEDLTGANSLNAFNQNLARLVGPPLGGIVVAFVGLHGVALLDAATFLLSAIAISFVTTTAAARERAENTATLLARALGVWREWVDGLAFIKLDRALSVTFLFFAISGVGEGLFGTLILPFVTSVLGGGSTGYGWVVGAQGAGGIAGGLLLARFGRDRSPALLLGWGAIGLGFIDLLTFTYHYVIAGLAPAIIFMAVVGVPAAASQVGALTLLQLAAPDAYRGRVFGALIATQALVSVIGAALAGFLGGAIGIVPVISAGSVAYIAGGIFVLARLRRWSVADRLAPAVAP